MIPGRKISRYRIVGPLGKGGMGEVFEAEDLRLGRRVALKFLPGTSMGEIERKRFLNEARLAAQLRHPHICPIFDVEEAEGHVFLSMALIDGETLARKIRNGPLPLESVLRWTAELLAGLEAAHTAGIVHRDIKTSNLMVDDEGRLSILDFGLAQRGGDERLTRVGQAVGTPAYMSPEQARGAAVDERADLWAAGMVLFEMLTGKLPEAGIDRVSMSRPGLPAALDAVVAKALAAHPAERWQSAREMRSALDAVRLDAPTQSLIAALPPPAKPVSTLWALAAIVSLALAGWAVFGRPDGGAPVNAVASAPSTARRVVILPLRAGSDAPRAFGDGLLELLADSIGEAERAGQKIWAVPVAEVRSRKLASAEEARRVYGVDFAVEGKVEAVGRQIRLTLDLIDTASLKRVGQESILFDLAEPLASRERALAAMRKLLSLEAARPLAAEAKPASGNAYAAYLEGRGLMARFDRAGNLDRAIQLFLDAVATDPAFVLAHASLGEAYWIKARTSNSNSELKRLAIEHARRAVALDPNLAVAHIKLGGILFETGQQEEAIRSLNRALDLAPGNADASRELAGAFAGQGKFAEAEKLYLAAIADRPTEWLGHLQLAFFYEDRTRLAEAETQLREAGKYAPENESVVRNLGRLYRIEGRYLEAVTQFLRAIQLQPSARAYNSLGLTYYFMHEYRKSVIALEAAIELDGAAHQYWGNLGSSSALSPEDAAKSVPSWRKAAALAEKRLELTPKLYSVLADLAEYRARLGDGKQALAAIDKIPESAREALAGRIVLAYELSGRRVEAIRAVRAYFPSPLKLREILDEPALAPLHADKDFERTVAGIKSGSYRRPLQ